MLPHSQGYSPTLVSLEIASQRDNFSESNLPTVWHRKGWHVGASTASEWIEFAETIGSYLLVLGGFIAASWRWLGHALFVVRFGRSVRSDFGDNAYLAIKELLEALVESHSAYEVRVKLLESKLRLGIYECDTEGRCILANETLCRTFGLDEVEMRGFGWLSAIAVKDRQRVHKNWLYSVESGTPYRENYVIENRRDKRYWRVETEAVGYRTPDGLLLGTVGFLVIHGEMTQEEYDKYCEGK